MLTTKDANTSFLPYPNLADITVSADCKMFELRKEDDTFKLYYVSPQNYEEEPVRVSIETTIHCSNNYFVKSFRVPGISKFM